MTNANHTLSSIQVLRAVAALAVVGCHMGAIQQKYLSHRLLPEWGMYGVDIFFVISGFIMAYVATNVPASPAGVGRFLLKRAWRIYPVYWQFTAVVLLAMLVKPELVNLAGSAQQPSVIKSLFLWPQRVDPHLGVGWSLVYELYFYLVFAAGLLLLRRYLRAAWWLWAALLGVAVLEGLYYSSPYAWVRVIASPYGFYFLLGAAASSVYRKGMVMRAEILVAIALVWVCIGFTVAYQMYGTVNLYTQMALRVACIGVPAMLGILALLDCERRGKIHYPAWLLGVGDASYSLYLSHSLILSGMGKLAAVLHVQGTLLILAYSLLMLGACLTLAMLNYRYVEKPLNVWYHKRLAT